MESRVGFEVSSVISSSVALGDMSHLYLVGTIEVAS